MLLRVVNVRLENFNKKRLEQQMKQLPRKRKKTGTFFLKFGAIPTGQYKKD